MQFPLPADYRILQITPAPPGWSVAIANCGELELEPVAAWALVEFDNPGGKPKVFQSVIAMIAEDDEENPYLEVASFRDVIGMVALGDPEEKLERLRAAAKNHGKGA